MRAGSLRNIITIQKQIKVDTGFSDKPEWVDHLKTRAEVNWKRGSRGLDGKEFVAMYSLEFNIRYHHDVDEGMRLIFEGKSYLIEAVMPNQKRRFKTLICKRVNE